MTDELPPIRRIVTGLGQDGRSRIIEDGPPPVISKPAARPGMCNANIWSTSATPAPVERPGLVLDKSRRLSLADLQACFRMVTPAGELVRGLPTSRVDRYPLFRVEGPVPGLLARGCPDELGKNRRR